MAVSIAGTGFHVPERILTNAELEQKVDTSDEWITTRTGIRERRIAEKSVPSSDMALAAAKNALQCAGIEPEALDFIIVATVTADRRCPSTACRLQEKLGASQCMAFDTQAACSGLLYNLEIASALLKADPSKKYGLIVGVEKLSFITDWSDRSTCVLFGDGASALVLKQDTASDEPDCIVASTIGADGKQFETITIPFGGTETPLTCENISEHGAFLNMMGQETFRYAVTAMYEASKQTLAKAGISPDALKWVIPHQANKRIIDAVAQRIGIPLDRLYVNVHRYGNTSAASIGICLDELNRAGKIQPGDYLLLTAFGAGFTWASTLIRW